jgi:arginase family enzyme
MINISDNLKSGMVAVIGIPFDAYSSFMQGAARAPAQIRKTMNSGAGNLCSESGIDLAARPDFIDLGDMHIDDDSDAIENIEASITELLNREVRLISLGGDHAITYPIIKSFHKRFGRLFNWMRTRISMIHMTETVSPMPARLHASWKKSWHPDWFRSAFERLIRTCKSKLNDSE